MNESEVGRQLIEKARGGDRDALNDVFSTHRDRLRRMVEMRLDRRLASRIDASDVVQDAFLNVAGRLDDYLASPSIPVFLWLRLVVGEQIVNVHRRHLGAEMRDAGREVALLVGAYPAASSQALAAHLLGREETPSEAAIQAERTLRLQEALNSMDEGDREVLTLRHFEQLTRSEAAEVLGINEDACAKRYLRALARMKKLLAELPGGLSAAR